LYLVSIKLVLNVFASITIMLLHRLSASTCCVWLPALYFKS